uniref:Uncharacterized protein n=1 Tax=Panagrolaimus superbus TaxID=310955 RepID=A0A914YFN2_9BILA
MPNDTSKKPLLPLYNNSTTSKNIAQTSFTNEGFDSFPEGGTGYLNPSEGGGGGDDEIAPPSIEDIFYSSDDDEENNYNEIDGNCDDQLFPSQRLIENQRKRLQNRSRRGNGYIGSERFSIMLVQLPDESCMLKCMTGTVISTLAIILFIIIIYCMRIRENTGLPMEMDDFTPSNPANDIMGMGTGF